MIASVPSVSNVSVEGSQPYADHVLSVLQSLNQHALPRAVLAEIGRVRGKTFTIKQFPPKEHLAGQPPVDANPEWWSRLFTSRRRMSFGPGGSSDVNLYYWPWLWTASGRALHPLINWYSVDEILLHELVYALRTVSPYRRSSTIVGDVEGPEFAALLLTNVYHSARGRDGLRSEVGGRRPLARRLTNSEEFYRTYQADVDRFVADLPSLAVAVASVPATYNPLSAAIAARSRPRVPAWKTAVLPGNVPGRLPLTVPLWATRI